MAKKIVLAFIFSALLTGCGSTSFLAQMNPINPPSVHAQTSLPVGCSSNGACAGTTTNTWGTCQWSSYQTSKTFVIALEIGVNSTPTDPSTSLCYVPLALAGSSIKTISGNTNFTSWNSTGSVASVFMDVRACTASPCNFPDQQEHIATAYNTFKPAAPVSIPLQGSFGTTGIPVMAFMVVFNDDLAPAKPDTLHLVINGTF